jgi:hypothetical protein
MQKKQLEVIKTFFRNLFSLGFKLNFILQPLQFEKFDAFMHNAEVKRIR